VRQLVARAFRDGTEQLHSAADAAFGDLRGPLQSMVLVRCAQRLCRYQRRIRALTSGELRFGLACRTVRPLQPIDEAAARGDELIRRGTQTRSDFRQRFVLERTRPRPCSIQPLGQAGRVTPERPQR
jgi:hypothetical protein